METLNLKAQQAKVAAGFKERGTYFRNFIDPTKGMYFEKETMDGIVDTKPQYVQSTTPVDTWFTKRN